MVSRLTNKQLQAALRQYPDDAQVVFVPGAEKMMAWAFERPDWAVRIKMINGQVHIFVADYREGG